MFLATTGLVVRALGGRGKHIQIFLRPSADRCVLRLGSSFDYGARGFNVNTLLPLVEFSKGDANQKFPFLFSPFGGGVGGGAEQRNARKFLGLPARVRERGRGAIGAYASVPSWHVLGACEVGSRKGDTLTAKSAVIRS
jgi:hypothetical protein